jgi:transposase InsO family protein
VSHANARLTPMGRRMMVDRIAAGQPVAQVAAQMAVSRTTAWRWWRRFTAEGYAGLVDRPSVARSHPRRTPAVVEARIIGLRRDRRLGPARIGPIVGLAPSTVHRVLTRHGLGRLSRLDRPTGAVIRRYERATPGELVHIDVKKLGRIPDGGGWRVHGRDSDAHRHRDRHTPPGWDYIHAAVDDHSRLAYTEVHPDERGDTCAAFLSRAHAWFAGHGITVQRILSDNAKAYRTSRVFTTTAAQLGVAQRFIRTRRPQTNGKVERFNRTLLEEWAYAHPYTTNQQRTAALDTWLHTYNHHRAHTALGGHPPIHRVNNPPGHYS